MSKRKPFIVKDYNTLMKIPPSNATVGRHSEGKKPYQSPDYQAMEQLDYRGFSNYPRVMFNIPELPQDFLYPEEILTLKSISGIGSHTFNGKTRKLTIAERSKPNSFITKWVIDPEFKSEALDRELTVESTDAEFSGTNERRATITLDGVLGDFIIRQLSGGTYTLEGDEIVIDDDEPGGETWSFSVQDSANLRYGGEATFELDVEIAGFNKWRIVWDALIAGATFIGMKEIEMHSTLGGADECVGGTGNPVELFDDNLTSIEDDLNPGEDAEYDWGGLRKNIIEIKLTAANGVKPPADTFDGPKDFSLEYYDGSSWVNAQSWTGEATWADGESRTFQV